MRYQHDIVNAFYWGSETMKEARRLAPDEASANSLTGFGRGYLALYDRVKHKAYNKDYGLDYPPLRLLVMHAMPVRWEPVLAIVRSENPQELHDYWQKIVAHWRELQAAGKIKGFSTPAALCLSPDWMEANRRQLSTINFLAARETLEQTLDAEGFSRDSFRPAFILLEDLQRLTNPNVPLPNWRDQLPKSSSWWFLVDRYFGNDPTLTTGFVTTTQPILAHAQSKDLERDLPVAGVPMECYRDWFRVSHVQWASRFPA